jgi:hypothetical protein
MTNIPQKGSDLMTWLHFALGFVLAALQASIKNPQSLAQEAKILEEIYLLIGVIMKDIHPNQPTTTTTQG